MLSNQKLDKISLLCHAVVSNGFARFCNPLNRGANFSWERFPEMMAGQCEDMVFIHGVKGGQEVKDHARKTGAEIATRMVQEAGFLNEDIKSPPKRAM